MAVLALGVLYQAVDGGLALAIPLTAKSLGANDAMVGVIVASGPLVGGLFALPMGILSDRYGRRRVLMLSSIIGVTGGLLLSTSSHPLAIMPFYGLVGLAHAAYRPTAAASVGELSPSGRIATSFGLFLMMGAVGMTIGPPVSGFIIQTMGHSYALGGAGLLMGVAFFLTLTLPRTRPQQVLPVSRLRFSKAGRSLWADWLLVLVSDSIVAVPFAFLPLFAIRQGITPVEVGLLFSSMQVANAVARVPTGMFLDRSRKIGLAIAVGMVVSSVAIGTIASTTSFYVLAGLMFLTGLARGIVLTTVRTDIAHRTPPGSLGASMGTFSTMSLGGRGLGPVFFGIVVALSSIRTSFLAAGIVGLVGFVVTRLLRGGTVMFREVDGDEPQAEPHPAGKP